LYNSVYYMITFFKLAYYVFKKYMQKYVRRSKKYLVSGFKLFVRYIVLIVENFLLNVKSSSQVS